VGGFAVTQQSAASGKQRGHGQLGLGYTQGKAVLALMLGGDLMQNERNWSLGANATLRF